MYGKKLSFRDSKILEDHLRGLAYVYDEHQYTQDDSQRIANALTIWLLVASDIASAYSLERCFSMTNLVRWPGRSTVDVRVLICELKTVLETIRSYDPNMGRSGFRAYKAWIADSVQTWDYIDFLRPLVYRLYGGDECVFRDLNTICQFWTRLTLQDVSWVEEQALLDYSTLELEMKSWVYPETTIDCLRWIISQWFDGFTLDNCAPDFSNGATSEVKRGRGVAAKVAQGRRTPELLAADAMISFGSPYYGVDPTYRPTAVGRFVPKGIDKKRFISMEPTVNQYYQYALFKAFDSWFQSHPKMRINLEDQDLSRALCLKGSGDGSYSTIDLSSASDTVTWTLVKELFRDNDEVLRYLKLVRTPTVDLYGTRIVMEKYAPMGSSLCFPIECIVFASVASYACHLSGIPQNFRVYGDDIVIDSRAYNYCLDLLEDLHFIPNRDKSYGPYSRFLEACGMESYAGKDVTPCRLSRRFDILKLRSGVSPQQLEGSIEFANKLYAYGFYKARRAIVADILAVYPSVPFSVDPERGIYHPDPDNQHLKYRWNRGLQRAEVQILTTRTETAPGPSEVRYLRTLEKIEHRLYPCDADNSVQVACGPTRGSLRKEWVSLGGLG